eukprot:411007-Amphidinium_carterae.1
MAHVPQVSSGFVKPCMLVMFLTFPGVPPPVSVNKARFARQASELADVSWHWQTLGGNACKRETRFSIMSLEERLAWASECSEEWPCKGVSWWHCWVQSGTYVGLRDSGEFSPPWTDGPRSLHHNDTKYEGPL